jgi:hypothetical protein
MMPPPTALRDAQKRIDLGGSHTDSHTPNETKYNNDANTTLLTPWKKLAHPTNDDTAPQLTNN